MRSAPVGAASNRDPWVGKCIFGHAHVEAFQQLDVFFAKALASMMFLLVLNVLDHRAEL